MEGGGEASGLAKSSAPSPLNPGTIAIPVLPRNVPLRPTNLRATHNVQHSDPTPTMKNRHMGRSNSAATNAASFDGASEGGSEHNGQTPNSSNGKKGRKAYTISKRRERWTDAEHELFLQAIKKYGREWRKIGEHIGTKTSIQIRSHAQKYFSKVERGVAETDIEVPPPRPKRKSSKELNAAATAAAAAAAAGPSGSRKVAEAQAAKTYKDIVPARQSKQPDLDGGIANMADAIATNISNSISSWAAWNDIKGFKGCGSGQGSEQEDLDHTVNCVAAAASVAAAAAATAVIAAAGRPIYLSLREKARTGQLPKLVSEPLEAMDVNNALPAAWNMADRRSQQQLGGLLEGAAQQVSDSKGRFAQRGGSAEDDMGGSGGGSGSGGSGGGSGGLGGSGNEGSNPTPSGQKGIGGSGGDGSGGSGQLTSQGPSSETPRTVMAQQAARRAAAAVASGTLDVKMAPEWLAQLLATMSSTWGAGSGDSTAFRESGAQGYASVANGHGSNGNGSNGNNGNGSGTGIASNGNNGNGSGTGNGSGNGSDPSRNNTDRSSDPESREIEHEKGAGRDGSAEDQQQPLLLLGPATANNVHSGKYPDADSPEEQNNLQSASGSGGSDGTRNKKDDKYKQRLPGHQAPEQQTVPSAGQHGLIMPDKGSCHPNRHQGAVAGGSLGAADEAWSSQGSLDSKQRPMPPSTRVNFPQPAPKAQAKGTCLIQPPMGYPYQRWPVNSPSAAVGMSESFKRPQSAQPGDKRPAMVYTGQACDEPGKRQRRVSDDRAIMPPPPPMKMMPPEPPETYVEKAYATPMSKKRDGPAARQASGFGYPWDNPMMAAEAQKNMDPTKWQVGHNVFGRGQGLMSYPRAQMPHGGWPQGPWLGMGAMQHPRHMQHPGALPPPMNQYMQAQAMMPPGSEGITDPSTGALMMWIQHQQQAFSTWARQKGGPMAPEGTGPTDDSKAEGHRGTWRGRGSSFLNTGRGTDHLVPDASRFPPDMAPWGNPYDPAKLAAFQAFMAGQAPLFKQPIPSSNFPGGKPHSGPGLPSPSNESAGKSRDGLDGLSPLPVPSHVPATLNNQMMVNQMMVNMSMYGAFQMASVMGGFNQDDQADNNIAGSSAQDGTALQSNKLVGGSPPGELPPRNKERKTLSAGPLQHGPERGGGSSQAISSPTMPSQSTGGGAASPCPSREALLKHSGGDAASGDFVAAAAAAIRAAAAAMGRFSGPPGEQGNNPQTSPAAPGSDQGDTISCDESMEEIERPAGSKPSGRELHGVGSALAPGDNGGSIKRPHPFHSAPHTTAKAPRKAKRRKHRGDPNSPTRSVGSGASSSGFQGDYRSGGEEAHHPGHHQHAAPLPTEDYPTVSANPSGAQVSSMKYLFQVAAQQVQSKAQAVQVAAASAVAGVQHAKHPDDAEQDKEPEALTPKTECANSNQGAVGAQEAATGLRKSEFRSSGEEFGGSTDNGSDEGSNEPSAMADPSQFAKAQGGDKKSITPPKTQQDEQGTHGDTKAGGQMEGNGLQHKDLDKK